MSISNIGPSKWLDHSATGGAGDAAGNKNKISDNFLNPETPSPVARTTAPSVDASRGNAKQAMVRNAYAERNRAQAEFNFFVAAVNAQPTNGALKQKLDEAKLAFSQAEAKLS